MIKQVRKIIISIILTTLSVTFILVFFALNSNFINSSLNNQKNMLNTLVSSYKLGGLDYLTSNDFSPYRLTIIESDGTVIWDSHADVDKMENHLNREEVLEAFNSESGQAQRKSETLSELTYYNATKLNDNLVLRISTDQPTITTFILMFVPYMLLIVIIIIIVGYFAAKFIGRKMVEPINKLDLTNPLSNEVYPELDPLLKRISKQNKQINQHIQQLEEKNHEIKYVTENVSDGILVINAQGTIITANKKAKQLLDCQLFEDYYQSYRNHAYIDLVKKALNGQSSTIVIKFGELSYRFNASSVISDSESSFIFIFITDITEEERALEIRRQFTANVSHELKTPLASIMGIAEIIGNGIVKPEDVQSFAQKIHHESERLLLLIQDIIKISKMDEGKISCEFVKVNLKMTVEEVLTSLQNKIELKKLKLFVDCQDVEISGFPPMLYELIFNLVDNAINYNKIDGELTISILKDKKSVNLIVKDSGIGISVEDLPHIFERFYRADKSHSKNSGGSGLGLSIVKHIANLHNGIITVKSKLGKGTEIKIKFIQ